MGQSEILQFLENEHTKDPERFFTKEEIESGINRKIKYRCLESMLKYGEIDRDTVEETTKQGVIIQVKTYRYVPNGSITIWNIH